MYKVTRSTIKLPVEFTRVLSTWHSTGESLSHLIQKRSIEIDANCILSIKKFTSLMGDKCIWVEYTKDRLVRELVVSRNSAAGQILRQFSASSLEPRQTHRLRDITWYAKHSPSLRWLVFAGALTQVLPLMQKHSVQLFSKATCDANCSNLLSQLSHSLVLVLATVLSGIFFARWSMHKAKTTARTYRESRGLMVESSLVICLALLLIAVFVSHSAGTRGAKTIALYTRWYKGETISVRESAKAEMASEIPSKGF